MIYIISFGVIFLFCGIVYWCIPQSKLNDYSSIVRNLLEFTLSWWLTIVCCAQIIHGQDLDRKWEDVENMDIHDQDNILFYRSQLVALVISGIYHLSRQFQTSYREHNDPPNFIWIILIWGLFAYVLVTEVVGVYRTVDLVVYTITGGAMAIVLFVTLRAVMSTFIMAIHRAIVASFTITSTAYMLVFGFDDCMRTTKHYPWVVITTTILSVIYFALHYFYIDPKFVQQTVSNVRHGSRLKPRIQEYIPLSAQHVDMSDDLPQPVA